VTSSDSWFRPADVAHAPDGSLYIADWYDSGVGGHGYRDKIIGRIYHLTMKGAPPPAKTASPDLKTIPGLTSSLMSPMPSVRFLAIEKLRERGPEAAEALTRLARDGQHPLERARALWVLFGMGELGKRAIVETLGDRDPRFRAQAVRMLREDMEANWRAILPLARDDDPEVRLEVTIALRGVTNSKTPYALADLVKRMDPNDAWYMPALANTLRSQESSSLDSELKELRRQLTDARFVALAWQLDHVDTVPYIAEILKNSQAADILQKALDTLGFVSDVRAGAEVALFAADTKDANLRRSALEILRRKMDRDWKEIAQRPIFPILYGESMKDPAARAQMLAIVGAARAEAFVPRVLELIDNPETDKATRRAALESLGAVRSGAALAKLTSIVKAARLPEPPPKVVSPSDEQAFVALSALSAADSDETRKVLHDLVRDRGYPTDLRRETVKLLGRSSAGCHFLLAEAEKNQLAADIKGDAAEVTNRSPDKRVCDLAAKLLPLPKLAGNRSLPPPSELLSRQGDVRRGQVVFNKPESQCTKCHRVGGIGAWVGPDLSQIGGKLGKEGLLDSILNPSAAIAHEYVQYLVETEKGQVYSGLIVDESAGQVILKNAEGERIVILAKDVASKKPSPVSIMPDNLVQNLSDQDLVDLLAYLGTLKQPVLTISDWQMLGPFAGSKTPPTLSLTGDYTGKDGAKLAWRKLSGDREGRLDLETALGTREAGVALHAVVQSKSHQIGKLVILAPAGAMVRAQVGDKSMTMLTAAKPGDAKGLVPSTFDLRVSPGKNDLIVTIVGNDKAPLAAVVTVVSAQGVDAATGK
jgi:putative heme-binding domain-containing protein